MTIARLLLLVAVLLPATAAGSPSGYGRHAEARAFASEMVERHGFVARELEDLFTRARRKDSILRAIRPRADPGVRSWQVYRDRFVNETRLSGGRDFHARHTAALQRAEREHGVPADIIVAIIGVETLYGRMTGTFRVIDALSTLAFDYPPRAAFFRSELEHYLLYARDAGLDVFAVKGSYAGAIGIPQFMPGSYRRYAVDFDGDGATDLRANPVDAIGSVANFLREHGWQRDEPVWLPTRVTGDGHRALLDAGIEPAIRRSTLARHGVEPPGILREDMPVALIEFVTPSAPTEFRLALRNFYVLTRYNRSTFYAAAVADLAAALRAARDRAR